MDWAHTPEPRVLPMTTVFSDITNFSQVRSLRILLNQTAGQRFDSSRDFLSPVAQSAEQQSDAEAPLNSVRLNVPLVRIVTVTSHSQREVIGSNPIVPTTWGCSSMAER